MGEQIFRNIVYWTERLRDRQDFVHVRTVGAESGDVTEAWFTVFHLSLLYPRNRRPKKPNPWVQFHYYPVEDGKIVSYAGELQANLVEGTVEASGTTLDIARVAALTDPERAEVVEIQSQEEFGKLRKQGD